MGAVGEIRGQDAVRRNAVVVVVVEASDKLLGRHVGRRQLPDLAQQPVTPHGVSGGASQGPAARQTRLHNTQRSPGSGRTALDVICEHNADAGEGEQGVEIQFYARMHKNHAKDGRDWGLRCDECSREWPPSREEARA